MKKYRDLTEQERFEIQSNFKNETGLDLIDGGEFTVDYVSWLENIVHASQSPAVAEVRELPTPNIKDAKDKIAKEKYKFDNWEDFLFAFENEDGSYHKMIVRAVEDVAQAYCFSLVSYISSLKSENERLKAELEKLKTKE